MCLFKQKIVNTLNQHLSNLQLINNFYMYLDENNFDMIINILNQISGGITNVEILSDILSENPLYPVGGIGFSTGNNIISNYKALILEKNTEENSVKNTA